MHHHTSWCAIFERTWSKLRAVTNSMVLFCRFWSLTAFVQFTFMEEKQHEYSSSLSTSVLHRRKKKEVWNNSRESRCFNFSGVPPFKSRDWNGLFVLPSSVADWRTVEINWVCIFTKICLYYFVYLRFACIQTWPHLEDSTNQRLEWVRCHRKIK